MQDYKRMPRGRQDESNAEDTRWNPGRPCTPEGGMWQTSDSQPHLQGRRESLGQDATALSRHRLPGKLGWGVNKILGLQVTELHKKWGCGGFFFNLLLFIILRYSKNEISTSSVLLRIKNYYKPQWKKLLKRLEWSRKVIATKGDILTFYHEDENST